MSTIEDHTANPLIDRADYFTNLPREFYVSKEVFDKELDAVYGRQWLYVAHVSEVPERGDYLAVELQGLGESILVVRGDQDRVNAFYNVCRHRGYGICDAGAGKAKQFVCPYHRWSYGLDGRLLGAPAMPDGEYFNYADYGLKPVHLEVWNGFIFVNLSAESPDPLAPRLEAVGSEMSRLDPEHLKVAHHVTYEMETNWKILMENWMECSHCAGVHSGSLCAPMDLPAIFSDVVEIFDAEEVGPMWIPIKEGMKTGSLNGEFVSSKLLGEFGRDAGSAPGFAAGFAIQPAISGAIFWSDYGVMHRIDPVSPTRTQLQNWWFVREDAEEGKDYQLEELMALWDRTNSEDSVIVESQQRGVMSRGFTPGPHSLKRESSMRAALVLYLEMMDA
ncbi:MAG: aromatic ring-hydroxylating oxygenase subunit alpha [Solirubrobacterales bacterium]